MANTSVNHRAALLILEKAVKESNAVSFRPSSRWKDAIASIASGTHLTYKYLLITALLAKSTNDEANPLVLQAGADAQGAYDARSLCHKVIVPHESRLLKNGLGGSNEPFLNKPARFTMIELTNAVRAGNDKRTLTTLHATLSAVRSQKEAFTALRDLVFFARSQSVAHNSDRDASLASAVGGREKIAAFLFKLIASSIHGETSVLAAAAVLWIVGKSRGLDWSIKVHPVNESGASSQEIGDIDVFHKDELVLSAEIKDKVFKAHDVEHAVQKIAQAGFHSLHFICGPRGKLKDKDQERLSALAAIVGVELYLLDLSSLILDTVAFAPMSLQLEAVVAIVQEFASDSRVKEDTLRQISKALQ